MDSFLYLALYNDTQQIFEYNIVDEKTRNQQNSQILRVVKRLDQDSLETKIIGRGASVYTLLHYGVLPFHKQMIYRLFVDLPLWYLSKEESVKVFPWTLFLSLKSTNETCNPIPTLSLIYTNDLQNTINIVESRVSSGNIESEIRLSRIYFKTLRQEFKTHRSDVAGGRFSFVDFSSGHGYLSTRIAKEYPNATVISIDHDSSKSDYHLKMISSLGITNNAICTSSEDDFLIHRNIYDCPELFRFQFNGRGLLDEFIETYRLSASSQAATKHSTPAHSNWGQLVGQILSTALTSFLVLPSAAQISYGYHMLFVDHLGRDTSTAKPYRIADSDRELAEENNIKNLDDRLIYNSHPVENFKNFTHDFLFHGINYGTGHANLSMNRLILSESGYHIFPELYRLDLLNLSRYVHHHYDYIKDGHTRTYSMHVIKRPDEIQKTNEYFNETNLLHVDSFFYNNSMHLQSDRLELALPPGYHTNADEIVSVGIHRDKDEFFIPYTTIYGITLISVLRMGLIPKQREEYFKRFLQLPLYEDMAPWNIVLMGSVSLLL